jgi:hypothetical protein
MASDFEQLARAFCEFCERDGGEGRLEFANELERQFSSLYAAALNLTPGDPPDEDAPRISQQEWRAVYDRVAAVLGDANHYWLIFDPFAQEAPVVGELADDVADTYRDLKEGVALIDATPAANASWDWHQSAVTPHSLSTPSVSSLTADQKRSTPARPAGTANSSKAARCSGSFRNTGPGESTAT